MTAPGEDADRDELLAAVNDYLDLLNQMDLDALRKDELAGFIAKRMNVGERIEVADEVGVQLVAGSRRFSAERAGVIFTPDQMSQISVATVSTTLAKRLYPVEFESSKVQGPPSLRRL